MFGALVLFWLLVFVVTAVDTMSFTIAKHMRPVIEKTPLVGCGAAIITIPIGIGVSVLAGLADMILWNAIAPQFDLPQIDLLTAIAIGWLIGSLVRGVSPQRVQVVRDWERDA